MKNRYIFLLLFLIGSTLVNANEENVADTTKLDNFKTEFKESYSGDMKKYLQEKKIIKMCVDPNWMPLDKIEEAKHVGVAADFLSLISQKIQTPIELVQTKDWSQSLQKIKNRECDILALAEQTPSRLEYLDFTTPYISMPLVIATKRGEPFIDNITRIKNKSLGVVRGYSQYELLRVKYPEINLVEVSSIEDGLEFVEQEKIFGFLDNSITINHEIQKYNMGSNIVISGQFPELMNLSIASRNDEAILGEILEKALMSIDDTTKENLINKWKNIIYQTKTDYKFMLQFLFFIFVAISMFVYWNLSLREEIKRRELLQKQLKISEEKFRTLFDKAPVLLNSYDKEGKVVLWNKECERIFGWTKEELLLSENPLSLFYPDVKLQEEVLDLSSHSKTLGYREWTPLAKGGEVLTIMWANVDFSNDDVVHIGYDVTQQRKNELAMKAKKKQLNIAKQELEELNNSLENRIADEIFKNTKQQLMLMHQSKQALMGEMLENIAHQWRQPLAQINSSVLLIDAAMEINEIENEKIEANLEEIETLTKYMSKTIQDFQTFFNPHKQKISFLLYQVITNSLLIVKGSLNESSIHISISGDNALMYKGYENELQQVIVVILNNAKDVIKERNIQEPYINIAIDEDSQYKIIKVCDNAGGVEDDLLEKIFEPYFTTKHKKLGTGLGLYMSKKIIEDGFKGQILVENTDNGVCFKILLPKEMLNADK